RFRLLTSRRRTATPHHQTLRATLDWSYDLLTPAERRLFKRLAVFIGGFTLEAAEAVCADVVGVSHSEAVPGAVSMPRDGSPLPKNDVFDLLSRLVDKSLVSVESQSERLARFRMLETTRAYALERLQASTDWDEVCRAHAAFFVELAERADGLIRGGQQKQWLETLEAEYDNIRAALRWLFDTLHVARGAR